MLNLHPNILKKDGKPEFVVLDYDEYRTLQEYLEDVEDLLDLRKAKKKEAKEPTLSLSEVKKKLGI
ncbi:MAG TPA: hypothetical protein VJZ24_01070 [Thermodesulfovibrionales bacterium]|nr:hypothetical protein [Thermodesulfovibrionales bacterium]